MSNIYNDMEVRIFERISDSTEIGLFGNLIDVKYDVNPNKNNIAKGVKLKHDGDLILTFKVTQRNLNGARDYSFPDDKICELFIPIQQDDFHSELIQYSFSTWFNKITKEVKDLKESSLSITIKPIKNNESLITIDKKSYQDDKITTYSVALMINVPNYPILSTLLFTHRVNEYVIPQEFIKYN